MGDVRVRLLGEELTLKGDGDPARLERLAAELDVMLKRMANDLNLIGQPTRTALLVSINLLDELNRLREKYASLEAGTHSAAEQMLKRIEHTLTLDRPEVPSRRLHKEVTSCEFRVTSLGDRTKKASDLSRVFPTRNP